VLACVCTAYAPLNPVTHVTVLRAHPEQRLFSFSLFSFFVLVSLFSLCSVRVLLRDALTFVGNGSV